VFCLDVVELVKYKGAKALLETLVAFPERLFTISELAKVAKVPFSSVWRLVRKWEPAGIVETGRIGGSVTVRLKKSAYTNRVIELVRLSVSPQGFTVEQLKETLAKTAGVKEAFLFGSVARGEEKLESDIDLAVWADNRFDADALVFTVAEKWGTKVVPLIFEKKNELNAFLEGKEHVRIV